MNKLCECQFLAFDITLWLGKMITMGEAEWRVHGTFLPAHFFTISYKLIIISKSKVQKKKEETQVTDWEKNIYKPHT